MTGLEREVHLLFLIRLTSAETWVVYLRVVVGRGVVGGLVYDIFCE